MAFQTAASVTRSSHRRHVASLRRNPNDDRLLPDWDDVLGGRVMTAACDLPLTGSPLCIETAVVRGRARCGAPHGCPGCSEELCNGRFGCVWASHVLKEPRLKNAVEWHKSLCSKVDAPPNDKDGAARANYIRVLCLLAIVVQACASEPLFEWLLEHLRPVSDDPSHPLVKSTAGFGERFANAIPPPPDSSKTADAGGGEPFSHAWFGGAGAEEAPTAERRAWWAGRLTKLLARLQTNLFYLDEYTIVIVRTACQLQHACRPNASVQSQGAPRDATFVVRSLRPLRSGERVSFCYLTDGPADVPLADQMPLQKRRKLIQEQLGFWCRCPTCEAEERAGSARGTR